ncbi:hypothetical protein SISSUDRAFT_1133238, partial [Sistotremastrum suecicum HHB10207 ss-3]
ARHPARQRCSVRVSNAFSHLLTLLYLRNIHSSAAVHHGHQDLCEVASLDPVELGWLDEKRIRESVNVVAATCSRSLEWVYVKFFTPNAL